MQRHSPVLDWTIGDKERNLEWLFRDSSGKMTEISQGVTQTTFPFMYETSLALCEHPTGKWWETMFLPLTQAGNVGLSLKAWGKKHATGGSTQVKIMSVNEWYDEVCSKVSGSKGYTVLSFMGRSEGLTNKHRGIFFGALSDNRVIGPGGATIEQCKFINAEHPANYGQMLAAKMMLGCMSLVPVLEFFKKLESGGHSIITTIRNEAKPSELKLQEQRDMVDGYIATIKTVMEKKEWQLNYVEKTKEPEVDRSTIYQEWGNFG